LVALPIKLAKSAGNISPLALCYRIGTSLNLLNPTTLQTAEVSTKEFWHAPFSTLADSQELIEFIVLDIEPLGPERGNLILAEATISLASDMDTTYYVRTHLGGVLHPGDSAMGFHLTGSNFNNPQFEALEQSRQYSSTIPDVVLVKKFYPRKKKSKSRNWKLKRLARVESDMAPRKQDQDKLERDLEMFLRDVEEDAELRAGLRLYKQQKPDDAMDVESTVDGDDEGLRIPMDELLDEFDELTVNDGEESMGAVE
jgi:nonsense-mediated mRNA decay protein 3